MTLIVINRNRARDGDGTPRDETRHDLPRITVCYGNSATLWLAVGHVVFILFFVSKIYGILTTNRISYHDIDHILRRSNLRDHKLKKYLMTGFVTLDIS